MGSRETALSPLAHFRNDVLAWLDEEESSLDSLIAWLQGYDLPSPQEDAYVWLLQALPLGHERSDYELRLAERLAELLRLRPDTEEGRLGRRPEQLLFNALMLATGLRHREVLAEPLWEMYERRQLSGDWLGASLRTALRAALIHNQVDQRLEEMWLKMSRGEADDFLGGNEFVALEGSYRMPDPKKGPGAPCLKLLGQTLKGVADWLDDDEGRRLQEFRRHLERVRSYLPSWKSAERDIVAMAEESNWPSWTTATFPSLIIPAWYGPDEKAGPTFYIWSLYLKVLLDSGEKQAVEVKRMLCRDRIAEVRFKGQAFERLKPVFEEREELRLRYPAKSDTEAYAYLGLSLAAHSEEPGSRTAAYAANALQKLNDDLLRANKAQRELVFEAG